MAVREKHKKIVVIGGGTGSFSVLRGLKKHPLSITAVVSMFDSGGSSGILRDEFGVLPPGDVRRCLLALSDEKEEKVLRDLFMFRFNKRTSLNGHSFGNLFLAALSSIMKDEMKAIEKAGELLKIKGTVLPVSLNKSHVHAKLEDGSVIKGETNIDVPKHNGDIRIEKVFLKPKARLGKDARRSILEADVIVIGPGDLYSSLIPNLLTDGMKDVLKRSKAKKVYVTNLMTKWGETNNLSISDCAREILSYAGLSRFDYIISNNKKMDADALRSYRREKKQPLLIDKEVFKLAGKVIEAPLFSGKKVVRHDSNALAKIIAKL